MNKKKIGIITHYDVHNHGAQLQLYALTSVLRNMGNEVSALTFVKNCDFLNSSFVDNYSVSLTMIPRLVAYLKKNGIKRAVYNYKKKKTLSLFRKEFNLEGEYYSRATDLDVVVIGSDEVFSIEAGLNPFFYGMGVPCNNVIAYAASFGPTTDQFIKNHFASEFISAGCKRISRISVRDLNSKEIVTCHSGSEPIIVCDPVILYDFSEEREKHVVSRAINEKYCIVYSYDTNMNDLDTITAIKSYAKKNNIKVLSIGNYHSWCDESINVPPLEIFSWFKNSEMVFTDTFHGTVFSIVCNAQFFSKSDTNRNKLLFLLEQFGLSDRHVVSFSEANNRNDVIDYEMVNRKILRIREESYDFLYESIDT